MNPSRDSSECSQRNHSRNMATQQEGHQGREGRKIRGYKPDEYFNTGISMNAASATIEALDQKNKDLTKYRANQLEPGVRNLSKMQPTQSQKHASTRSDEGYLRKCNQNQVSKLRRLFLGANATRFRTKEFDKMQSLKQRPSTSLKYHNDHFSHLLRSLQNPYSNIKWQGP